MQSLTITRLELANAVPCQQTYAACDLVATLHIVGPDWDVDVCLGHSREVIAEFNRSVDCPDCGLPILDMHDVVYANGTARHTDAYHRVN